MFRNRFYYRLKPVIPVSTRLAIRRWFAFQKRAQVSGIWPILPASERRPKGWPGWPDGKQFALVLTHDVEGPQGVARCRQLMRLEKELGFRSSFNFIPEGDYRVSRELREELIQNGFEVGVHDLRHDGKLYRTRRKFSENAQRINRHLKDWGATGFRSGFMLHNLDWLHDLDIQYDASTFDTDPFEPQPDGVNTIFPFWVPRPAPETRKSEIRNQKPDFRPRTSDFSRGYVELPYTLPQDSTLFLLLGEHHPDIWFQKLDWIAKHGGMALLNVHPDYLCFDGEPPSQRTYSAEFYARFLQYARRKYGQSFWHVLPREMAAFVKGNQETAHGEAASSVPFQVRSEVAAPAMAAASVASSLPNGISTANLADFPGARLAERAPSNKGMLRGRRAAVVLFSNFPADPRPYRAAAALAAEGVNVDVICLRANDEEARSESADGINIFRVPLKRRRGGKMTYIFQYSAFTLGSLLLLAFRSLTCRYDLVHVHNMPDILVFSALVPKMLGAKVILDLHDPMPELMTTIFQLHQESLAVRILKRLEKWSTGFADLVLTVNLATKKIYCSRSCPPEKILIVMNSPAEHVFQFQPPVFPDLIGKNHARPFVIMYHGSLLERNGLDLAVDALETVRRSIPNAMLKVHGGRTQFLDEVMVSVQKRGLGDAVQFLGEKNRSQVVEAIDECDIGIIPNRRTLFSEINTPTRIFEYLSRGKPAIVPQAAGIRDYFGDQDLIFFELGNAADLAKKIEYAFFNPAQVREIIRRGQQVYLAHRWSREKSIFLDSICGLLDGNHCRMDSESRDAVHGRNRPSSAHHETSEENAFEYTDK